MTKKQITKEGSVQKYNQKGIRYKTKFKPMAKTKSRGILDEQVRSEDRFSVKTIEFLRKRMTKEGFTFKKVLNKGKPFIVVKNGEFLTGFYVPMMNKANYDSFLLLLKDKILDTFKEKDDK